MTEPAIRAVGLGKRYSIGLANRAYSYGSLRETISEAVAALWRRPRGTETDESRGCVWALRDVSLDVRPGEVVGIIGRNGAGKSTFLKVLGRITRPTEGYADLTGRVGSLLEVGTGFHPELTGRDNLFLSGAILGMQRADIRRQFDEIVDFAGVARFIDTPVKRYSSGMYVRLAFAVAAHLNPEILLVDEVLAVGDAEFQKRCLGKMHDIVQEGRTVLFVSHNLAAIKALCPRVVLFDQGRVVEDGAPDAVVDTYLKVGPGPGSGGVIPEEVKREGTGEARCRRVELMAAGSRAEELYLGQPFSVAVTVDVRQSVPDAVVEVGISTLDGTRVASSFTVDHARPGLSLDPGRYRFVADFSLTLLPRMYTIDVGVHRVNQGTTLDMVERVAGFRVLNVAEHGGDSHMPHVVRGFVRPLTVWHTPERVDVTIGTGPS